MVSNGITAIFAALIVISISSIVIGIFGMFFLQTTIASTSIPSSSSTTTFELNTDTQYMIVVHGRNYAEGYGSGYLELYNETNALIVRFKVTIDISEDEDGNLAMDSVAVDSFFTPSISGRYYMAFTLDYGSIIGDITVEIRESLIASLFGVNELDLIFIGIFSILIYFGLYGGYCYISVHNFHADEENPNSDNGESPSQSDNIPKCPNCGSDKRENGYCQNCGSLLE